MGVRLFAHLVILFFDLALNIFSYVMHTKLGFLLCWHLACHITFMANL
jgi:hypothetical protein